MIMILVNGSDDHLLCAVTIDISSDEPFGVACEVRPYEPTLTFVIQLN